MLLYLCNYSIVFILLYLLYFIVFNCMLLYVIVCYCMLLYLLYVIVFIVC